MKKLHFTPDAGSAFYKDLTGRLHQHFEATGRHRSGGRRLMGKTLLYFGLVLLFYTAALVAPTPVLFVTAYLLMGLAVLLVAFNVSHDAAHKVAVRSPFWNKVLFQLSFNLQGNNAYVWGRNHNESHHLYTNVEGSDIDVLNNPLVRLTETQTVRWYHRFQHLYCPLLYLLYSLNWTLFREVLMAFRYSSRTIEVRMPAGAVFRLILLKLAYLGYMIVLPVVVAGISWKLVLLAFFLNHFMVSLLFVAVLGVSHVSDYVQHPEPDGSGKLAVSWPSLQLITSVDYNPASRFFNWTLGGFNAHALHHLLPNISHVHYLDILPIFRAACRDHGIPYIEMPYGEALRAHFRFLRKMGRSEQLQIVSYAR